MNRTAGGRNAPAVLDAEHAAFVAGDAISSAVAGRDASNQPSLAKALAIRVRADRRTVEVFVDGERAVGLLRDLRAGSPVAVVCSEPVSHRTIQIKGERVTIEGLAPGDATFVSGKVEAVVAHIAQLGFPPTGLRAYFSYTPAQLAKFVFAATAAFVQTPGPGAGARIEP